MNKRKLIANLLFSFAGFFLVASFILYSRVSLFFEDEVDSSLLSSCSDSIAKSYLINLAQTEKVLFVVSLVAGVVFVVQNIILLIRICTFLLDGKKSQIYLLTISIVLVNLILNGVMVAQLAKVIWALEEVQSCSGSKEITQNYQNNAIVLMLIVIFSFLFLLFNLILQPEVKKKQQKTKVEGELMKQMEKVEEMQEIEEKEEKKLEKDESDHIKIEIESRDLNRSRRKKIFTQSSSEKNKSSDCIEIQNEESFFQIRNSVSKLKNYTINK